MRNRALNIRLRDQFLDLQIGQLVCLYHQRMACAALFRNDLNTRFINCVNVTLTFSLQFRAGLLED